MDSPTPELDILALIAGIKTVFAEKTGITKIEDYARIPEFNTLPMLAFEISGIEPDPDDGGDSNTGQFSAVLRLAVYTIFSRKTIDGKKGKVSASAMAAHLCGVLRNQRFGCPVGPAEQIHAIPEWWEPDPRAVEMWRVEWQHKCYLGTSLIDEELIANPQVFLGIAPKIGTAHASDYREVGGDADLFEI